MREILFRGKGTNGTHTGEWVYGYYCENFWGRSDHGILPVDKKDGGYVEVTSETVGQYTGLTDKNGRKIFEGDILRVVSCEYDYKTTVGHRNGYEYGFYVGGDFGDGDFTILDWAVDYWRDDDAEIEVIGNIHDNPELLGNAHE